MLDNLVRELPTEWIENFVTTFEEGRVQKHPQARFVNARGECCLVGALAGARSGEDVVQSGVWQAFLNTSIEELSRRFEACRLTGQAFYDEAVLALAARRFEAADSLALSISA